MNLGNVLILGDSYSTFQDYIPKGYACYYTPTGRPETDIRKVEETWWHMLLNETNSNLVLNNSWSGSTVCYTGYGGVDCSKTSSFIYRFEQLINNNFFNENRIDTVLIFGGTNDSWSDAPLGQVKFKNFEKQDLYNVLPAMAYLLKTICETLPNAKVYCLINSNLKPEINFGYKAAADYYGVKAIEFENINKNCNHPTIQGMLDIKNQLLQKL